MAKADFTYPSSVSIRGYNPVYDGNKWQIKQAAEAITKAKSRFSMWAAAWCSPAPRRNCSNWPR